MTTFLLDRKQHLVSLGYLLSDIDNQEIINISFKAEQNNPWFTQENIKKSLDAIRVQFLSIEALDRVIDTYYLDDNVLKKTIGLIPAGNIPLVGFHDILCCYLVGHHIKIKLSEKDTELMRFLIDKINSNHDTPPIKIVEKLEDYDAIIATGSDNSARVFKHYFSNVPSIIRHNRTSVAVLTGNESFEELTILGDDVFSFFGLGCRNVGKIFVPIGYDLGNLFKAFIPYADIIAHNKYKNNFDYNLALWLLSNETFYHNDFIAFKISDALHARIGSINIEYYADINSVIASLQNVSEKIQCIIANSELLPMKTLALGIAQYPEILDFPDNVDTIQFLLNLN
ncbi:MAG: acyl-CoA reductase [Saprospiraceae bacterium]